MKNIRILLFILILSQSAWDSSSVFSAQKPSCVTGECHPKMVNQGKSHPKGKGCDFCHTPNNLSHPDTNGNEFTLSENPCIECHGQIVEYAYLHPPVAAGDCMACHAAHDNGIPNFLKKQDQKICYTCHRPVVKPEDTVLHGDIAQGKCNSCHTVHGSFYPNLLRDYYSTAFFNDYDEKHYKLCFRCHKIDLLLHPRTSYNTKFRDSTKNLHFTHVNRLSNGRSCKLCHIIHAGTIPKMMAGTVTFGNWQMPVNFTLTEKGGQCSPGCHTPRQYSR